MRVLTAAATYFGLVFGAGFILGVVRTLALVPWVGERTAELIETPFMLVIVVFAARRVGRKITAPGTPPRLAAGGLALLFLLAAELGVVFFIRGQSLGAYVESRDPLAGTVYLLALAWMGLAPAIVGRQPATRGSNGRTRG